MPMAWESLKPIEEGLAETLANFVWTEAGVSYGERSLEIPTQELKEEDIDEALGAWWSWVKDEWEDFKKCRKEEEEARKKKKLKIPQSFSIWVPSVQFFGDEAVKEIERRIAVDKYKEKIEEARKDLESLVGFRVYAYQKREFYGLEEHIK